MGPEQVLPHCQSGFRSNCNEGILHILLSSEVEYWFQMQFRVLPGASYLSAEEIVNIFLAVIIGIGINN